MAIELNITDADIEEIVKQQLITSGIGGYIKKGVSECLNGYSSPINDLLAEYVKEIASDIIREKYAEEIKTMIISMIEEQVNSEVLGKIANESIRRMKKAADDYY